MNEYRSVRASWGALRLACTIGMHSWFGEFGQHGHAHGKDAKCAGHGHGECGHSRGEMSEETRAAMLRQLEMQMEMMTSGRHISHGHVLHDPLSPDPRPVNSLLFGYGHDPGSPPYGWGSLAEAPSPLTDAMMPVSSAEGQRLSPAERNHFWSPRFPLLGRLRIVKDAAGLAQACIVILYWLVGNWCLWSAVLLPYYADGVLPISLLLSKKALCCCDEWCQDFSPHGHFAPWTHRPMEGHFAP